MKSMLDNISSNCFPLINSQVHNKSNTISYINSFISCTSLLTFISISIISYTTLSLPNTTLAHILLRFIFTK